MSTIKAPPISIDKSLSEEDVTVLLKSLIAMFEDRLNTPEQMALNPAYVARTILLFDAYPSQKVRALALYALKTLFETSTLSYDYFQDYVTPQFYDSLLTLCSNSAISLRVLSLNLIKMLVFYSRSTYSTVFFENPQFMEKVMLNMKRYKDIGTLACCSNFVLTYSLLTATTVDHAFVTTYLLPAIDAICKTSISNPEATSLNDILASLVTPCINVLMQDQLHNEIIKTNLLKTGAPLRLLTSSSHLSDHHSLLGTLLISCFGRDMDEPISNTVTTTTLLESLIPLALNPKFLPTTEFILDVVSKSIAETNYITYFMELENTPNTSDTSINVPTKDILDKAKSNIIEFYKSTKKLELQTVLYHPIVESLVAQREECSLERLSHASYQHLVKEIPMGLAVYVTDTLRNSKTFAHILSALDVYLAYIEDASPWHTQALLSLGIVSAFVRLFSHPEPSIQSRSILCLYYMISSCMRHDAMFLNHIKMIDMTYSSNEIRATKITESLERLRVSRAFCGEVIDGIVTLLSHSGGTEVLYYTFIKSLRKEDGTDDEGVEDGITRDIAEGVAKTTITTEITMTDDITTESKTETETQTQAEDEDEDENENEDKDEIPLQLSTMKSLTLSPEVLIAGRSLHHMMTTRTNLLIDPVLYKSKDTPSGRDIDMSPAAIQKMLAHVRAIPKSLQYRHVISKYKTTLAVVFVYATQLRTFNRNHIVYCLDRLNHISTFAPQTVLRGLLETGTISYIISLFACQNVALKVYSAMLLIRLLYSSRNATSLPLIVRRYIANKQSEKRRLEEDVMQARENTTATNTNTNDKPNNTTSIISKQKRPLDISDTTTVTTNTPSIPKSALKKRKKTIRRVMDWCDVAYSLFSITLGNFKERHMKVDKLSAVIICELFSWFKTRAKSIAASDDDLQSSALSLTIPPGLFTFYERSEIISVIVSRCLTEEEYKKEMKFITDKKSKKMSDIPEECEDDEEEDEDDDVEYIIPDHPTDEETRSIFKRMVASYTLLSKILEIENDS